MDRGLNFLSSVNIAKFYTQNIGDISKDANLAVGDYGFINKKDDTNNIISVMSKDKQYINYRGQWNNSSNKLKPYDVEDDDAQSKITIKDLIKWSNKEHPAIAFSYSDFFYLKDVNRYPNNRLIALRRYKQPIGHNIFRIKVNPISTVLGYVKPEDENIFTIGFNENWEDLTMSLNSLVESVFDMVGLGKNNSTLGSIISPSNPLMRGIYGDITKRLGITNDGSDNLAVGNPNLMNKTSIRRVGDGIATDLNFTFTTEYVPRYITGSDGNLDPSIAFLDIVSNIIRMGTSETVYEVTGRAGDKAKALFDRYKSGNIALIYEDVSNAVESAFKQIQSFIKEASSNILNNPQDSANQVLEAFTSVASSSVRGLLSANRIKIEGAISAMTGTPNAYWHLMIGNPKKPIVSIGNMIVDKVTLSFNNELGYDDYPTVIKATFNLKPARPLGLQELQAIFSAGQDKYYSEMPRKDYLKYIGDSVK